jgi:hypothetical protein
LTAGPTVMPPAVPSRPSRGRPPRAPQRRSPPACGGTCPAPAPGALCSARGTACLRGERRTGPRRSGLPGSSSLRWRRVDRWRAGQGQWQARRRQGNGAYSCLAQVWAEQFPHLAQRLLEAPPPATPGNTADQDNPWLALTKAAGLSYISTWPNDPEGAGAEVVRRAEPRAYPWAKSTFEIPIRLLLLP